MKSIIPRPTFIPLVYPCSFVVNRSEHSRRNSVSKPTGTKVRGFRSCPFPPAILPSRMLHLPPRMPILSLLRILSGGFLAFLSPFSVALASPPFCRTVQRALLTFPHTYSDI